MVKSQRAMLVVGIAMLLALPAFAADTEKKHSKEETPDATVKFSGGSVGIGIGFSWGSGVLTYKGKDYPFSVSGLSAGDIGASSTEASGDVYGLKKLEDFNGNYTSTSAGAAVGGGGGAATMRNQNGVSMHLVATARGVKLRAAVDGVKIQLKQ
ncbi:MAG TPA: hypothetical protein VMW56_07360 [Candidatus Margulisiibacteriota bacterium]|nr:hypothetical protein [Candidatus Margulisiibacteriota bacterium]